MIDRLIPADVIRLVAEELPGRQLASIRDEQADARGAIRIRRCVRLAAIRLHVGLAMLLALPLDIVRCPATDGDRLSSGAHSSTGAFPSA